MRSNWRRRHWLPHGQTEFELQSSGRVRLGDRCCDRDLAKRLPDAALERRPAQVKLEIDVPCGLVHEAK